MDDPRDTQSDAVSVAQVTRVSGHVRVVAGHGNKARATPGGPGVARPVGTSLSDLLGPAAFLRAPIVAFVVGMPVAAVAGDAGWVVLILAVAAAGLRLIDRRLGFTFADGVIGPRIDLGWPRGVQEDDDVRWSWDASGAPSS